MLKALALTLGIATVVAAGTIVVQAAPAAPESNWAAKQDRGNVLPPVPTSSQKRDRLSA